MSGRSLRSWDLYTIAVTLLIAFVSFSSADAGPKPSWQVVRKEEGIVTMIAERGDDSLPAFRARATLPGTVWDALAILEDVDHACDWTAHCREMKQVERYTELDRLVYARVAAPWPVRDRDVVTRVRAKYGRPGELHLTIRGQRSKAVPVDRGVIRMPRFTATYYFRSLSAERTAVQYEVDVDPGGALPDWLKRMIARDFPHDTLSNLRKRMNAVKSQATHRARALALEETARRDGFVALAGNAPSELAQGNVAGVDVASTH